MPRLTGEELQDAKRKKRAEERLAEEEEEARLIEIERRQQERDDRERTLFNCYTQLESYVSGIYEEVNKFSTKWPTHTVTPSMIDRANRAIKDTRELLKGEPDQYLDEIQIFVPAGDAIQAQDVTLALRTVRDALARMRQRHSYWSNFR